MSLWGICSVLGTGDAPGSTKSPGRWLHSPIGESRDRTKRKVYFGSLFEESTVLHGREGRATDVATSISAGTWGNRFTRGGWLGQEATNRI